VLDRLPERGATGFGAHRTGYLPRMAITDSREVVIEATPDEIMDVLFDIESLTEWSSAHKEVEVLERDDQNHPTRSRQVVKLVGVSDEQELAYTVYDDGVGWTLVSSKQQRAQEGRYTLTPDGDSTKVHFELTVDLVVPVPGFLVKKGAKSLMDTATEGLARGCSKSRSAASSGTGIAVKSGPSRLPARESDCFL
jgi:hypothetical protein